MPRKNTSRLNTEQSLKLLEILGSWKDKEADRFWTRFNFLFLINSALLTAVLLVVSSQTAPRAISFCGIKIPFVLFISTFGLFTAFSWLFMLLSAKQYETRLIADIDRLRGEQKFIEKAVTGHSDTASGTKHWRATFFAMFVAGLFMILWFLLALSEWSILRGPSN